MYKSINQDYSDDNVKHNNCKAGPKAVGSHAKCGLHIKKVLFSYKLITDDPLSLVT